MWSDIDKHIEFANELYENINYYAVEASMKIAKEKNSYEYFEGSDWQTGDYLSKRSYTTVRCKYLEAIKV